MRGRWRLVIIRALIASALAWVFATVPIPRVSPIYWVAYVQVPIVAFLLICYIGKLLIDTIIKKPKEEQK